MYAGGGGEDATSYYDSSSPDGSHSSSAAEVGGKAGAAGANKNIIVERDSRRKLYALRSVVPNITKVSWSIGKKNQLPMELNAQVN
jgi:hypothetical protein